MLIKNYRYLAASALPLGYELFDDNLLLAPSDFLKQLQPAEGIVVGTWNQDELLGRVTALGVCLERGASGARIDWREVGISLKPNPSGRTHWRTKSFFGFAASVSERYGFADLFAERFPELDTFAFGNPAQSAGAIRRLPTVVTPGFVYLIRSQYGFKIGKTVNMKSRTRLFAVKLPFPISVEHFSWFENYSEAERAQHELFRRKRLEGEWFNLDAADIAHIKTLGAPATTEQLRNV